jgi:hypothetical protein
MQQMYTRITSQKLPKSGDLCHRKKGKIAGINTFERYIQCSQTLLEDIKQLIVR